MIQKDEADMAALRAQITVAHTLAYTCFTTLAKFLPDGVPQMSLIIGEAIQRIVKKQEGNLPTRTVMLLAETEPQKLQDLLPAHKELDGPAAPGSPPP